MMRKPIYGLTGGIACGKTTVAKLFKSIGIEVIDADLLAREIVQPGTEGFDSIIQAFGKEILSAEGSIDREKLSHLIFSDLAQRKKLESITHPLIAVATNRRIEELQSSKAPYLLYEAALLVETSAYKLFDELIVVATNEEIQLQRLQQRNHIDYNTACARINAQLPLAEKIAVAQHVITNNGSLEELNAQVLQVHKDLMQHIMEKNI